MESPRPPGKQAPDGDGAERGSERHGSVKLAAGLIGLAGAVHVVAGLAAIGGADGLEANVREIQDNPDFGDLYLGLGAWGAIVLVVGVAELIAAGVVWRRASSAYLGGLIVAYAGLAAAFFGLAIFRFVSLVTVALLLLAIYLLSYRSKRASPR